MAKGMSLHIGLNRVDPNHYQGWDGQLKGCEQDAKDMAAIARKQKFAASMLLNEQATADAVKVAISTAAGKLKSGDTFLLTYSGHGGQVPDTNGDETEDQYDETWVLFDRELVDDELSRCGAVSRPACACSCSRIAVTAARSHAGSWRTRGPLVCRQPMRPGRA